MSRSHSS